MNPATKKTWLLVGIVLLWVALGGAFRFLAMEGVLEPLPLPEEEAEPAFAQPQSVEGRLYAAQQFVDRELNREGHIKLYHVLAENGTFPEHNKTNSEAVTYYLQWAAQAGDKERFDAELSFIENQMMHPEFGHLQWRIEDDGAIVGDGRNIASDADLRAIRALLLAEERWGDARYSRDIDRLASGLEDLALTDDDLLAPYGGPVGQHDSWVASEVYLSYADFQVFRALAERRGEPWDDVYANMKEAVLGAQIHNGLYNSYMNSQRDYGNGIDGGNYAINSLWIMVRAAESGDPELEASAREGLAFYKEKYAQYDELYPAYTSDGSAISPSDTPWVYALVGRAAVALDDRVFADAMVSELLERQEQDSASPVYGGFPEGATVDRRVGQFTTQESILTLQEYVALSREGPR